MRWMERRFCPIITKRQPLRHSRDGYAEADVAVSGSRRYRPFENYLLPSAHFEQLTEKQQTRLSVSSDAETYLAAKQQEILQKLAALQESNGKVEGTLTLDEQRHLHLPQLE